MFAHIGTDEQPHEAFASVHYDASSNKVSHVEHHNEKTSIKSRKGNSVIYKLEEHFNSVKQSNKPGFVNPLSEQPQQPSALDSLNYIRYQMVETQKHNLHVRAIQSCITNQLNWDVYTQLLDLSPSRAISNRLNVAVEASLGGNGFYNVKRCELAINVAVISTLRTNSNEKVTVNGKGFTVKEIVRHMGVIPDPEKCFAMPLLVFTAPTTGVQVVGQLTLEGVINTQKLSYIEACIPNKAFVFLINDFGHFFFEYTKNFTESAEKIRNATDRFLVASSAVQTRITNFHKQHELSKIHILSIVQPLNLKEKEYNHFPTGVYSNDIYSIGEHQSISLGLMKLMEAQNFERFAAREFAQDWNRDKSSDDASLYYGSGNFLDGVGNLFIKAGEGGGALLYGLGGGVGNALNGIGSGVGTAGKGIFNGIGEALNGSLLSLGLPLIAIAIVAIIGVVIYKQLKGKSKMVEPPPSYYEEEKSIKGKRKGFSFDNN